MQNNNSQLKEPEAPLTRRPTAVLAPPEGTPSFAITGHDKSFKHQYANIYFMRLHALRRFVEHNARQRWAGIDGNPVFVPRVLDVEKGQLSYVIGTVYMDMPLKPNVLDDIARDHSIPAPPPREKYHSAEDDTMLEDESGRIRLVGDRVKSARLVTGVIIGALGIETNSGDFEVVDICLPGMAPQPGHEITDEDADGEAGMDVEESQSQDEDEWIALVSGLEVGIPSEADGQLQLLAEYLTGEAGGLDEQTNAARISRLVIAGNSLATITTPIEDVDKKAKKYGQETSTFSPHPIRNLSAYLTDIARSMPVHLLPGALDPTGTLLPQQPLPRAMFGNAAAYASFACETNPTYLHVSPAPAAADEDSTPPATGKPSGSKSKSNTSNPTTTKPPYTRSLLVHSGQPLDDLFRYLPSPPISRLAIAEATLRWRHIAPTAPDTLWCHPYLQREPFVVHETPDVYVVGNQPRFATKLVREGAKEGGGGEKGGGEGNARCRIVLVPRFRESGVLVLVNLRTLAVRRVCMDVQGMSGGGG
ncbi:hypothetical protein BDW22DRAFT_1378725, partial [Trametopsis cervina]